MRVAVQFEAGERGRGIVEAQHGGKLHVNQREEQCERGKSRGHGWPWWHWQWHGEKTTIVVHENEKEGEHCKMFFRLAKMRKNKG